MAAEETGLIPRDEFSTELRRLESHPEGVIRKALVELVDTYGNVVTWVIRTGRINGRTTVLLERQTAAKGDRWVLPAEVVAAMNRAQDSAITVTRKRGARKAAATREAKGIKPAFVKAAQS